LNGFGENWIYTNNPEAKFSNLDNGDYTFEAQARLEGQEWGKACIYSFKVEPPFWKRVWFRLLTVGLLLYSVILIFRFRNKQLIQRQEQLEVTVKERTSEIEQQKTLIEEKQKEIVDSINYARRIQYALLAHEDFLKQELPEHFVFFHPKDIVSGDFYWATVSEERVYLAVCDSTGHGVPGAFMSLLSIGFLTEAINEKKIINPNEVFNFVRKRLIENISREGQKDGFDGILICIDKGRKRLTYAAANNVPVLVREGVMLELKSDRMPVGVHERSEPFQNFEVEIMAGDILYLYTDGYADQFGGPRGKKFKYRPMNQLLLDISTKSFTEQKETLSKRFEDWKGPLEQIDDVCVLGLRLKL
jgi:serine phosphatase RsbU (regulator of sigma subunit)